MKRFLLIVLLLSIIGLAFTPQTLALQPRDSDGDGLPDHLDQCPTEPGPRENGGCPRRDEDGESEDNRPLSGDRDGDGTPDGLDRCPDQGGHAATGGCPDSDGDGTGDPFDQCPTEGGPDWNGGCPSDSAEPPPIPEGGDTTSPTGDGQQPNPSVNLFDDFCVGTPLGSQPVNVRMVPSQNAPIVGMLNPGELYPLLYPIYVGEEMWYPTIMNPQGFVASWVLHVSEGCLLLPSVEPQGNFAVLPAWGNDGLSINFMLPLVDPDQGSEPLFLNFTFDGDTFMLNFTGWESHITLESESVDPSDPSSQGISFHLLRPGDDGLLLPYRALLAACDGSVTPGPDDSEASESAAEACTASFGQGYGPFALTDTNGNGLLDIQDLMNADPDGDGTLNLLPPVQLDAAAKLLLPAVQSEGATASIDSWLSGGESLLIDSFALNFFPVDPSNPNSPGEDVALNFTAKLFVGDVNGDGIPDLTTFVVGDFDGNGTPDLIGFHWDMPAEGTLNVPIFMQPKPDDEGLAGVPIFMQIDPNGDGVLSVADFNSPGDVGGFDPQPDPPAIGFDVFLIGDFNGDGMLDVRAGPPHVAPEP